MSAHVIVGSKCMQPNNTTMGIQDTNCCCPGYESILNELLSLAKLVDYDAAPTGVLLSGCAGVGKSRMASLLQKELAQLSSDAGTNLDVLHVSAKDIILDVASSSLDDERRFDQTNQNTANSSVIQRLLIIDDLDVIIADSDEAETISPTNNMESEQLRALNAAVKLIDSAINSAKCFLMGLSRAPLSRLPTQLARVGRIEKEVVMSPPSLGQRKHIFEFWLSTLPTSKHKLTTVEWADMLAPRTAGCVASDIRRICADALTAAIARQSQSLEQILCLSDVLGNTNVEWSDVRDAAQSCIPYQLASMDVIPAMIGSQQVKDSIQMDARQQFDMAWNDFGGYNEMKMRLFRTVVKPWRHHIIKSNASHAADASSSSANDLLDSSRPSGILFHGPAGNGKTLAAMCLASSLGLNCVKIRSSEVFSQWLGGSEATLRSIFSRARAASPCILLFDEFDSLAMNREQDCSSAASGVQSRILTTLLNEMDGITNAGSSQNVLVVAATNRLDSIDAALLRPGRLEEHVLLSNPDAPSVLQILKMRTKKMPLNDSINLIELSEKLSKVSASCAEVEGLCRDSCLNAMRRCSDETDLSMLSITDSDIEDAFRLIRRSPVNPS